jgi:hypothetical protein
MKKIAKNVLKAVKNMKSNDPALCTIPDQYGNINPIGDHNGNPEAKIVVNNNGANFLNLNIIFLFPIDFYLLNVIMTHPWYEKFHFHYLNLLLPLV